MKITKRQIRRIIREAMELDLEVGDVILTGKFKNKRKVVKDFGTDDLGQPTINGTKALNFRIEKHMPKEKWSKKSKEALEFADTVAESIARRKIRKMLREALSRDAQDLEPRLVAVWEQVSADTLQALGGQASWEEIGEEVMASGYSIDPDLIESINLLPFEEQQKLFQKTFGAGRRY